MVDPDFAKRQLVGRARNDRSWSLFPDT